MDIVISHASAFLFWRRFAGNRNTLPKARNPRGMTAGFVPAPALDAELEALGLAPKPSASAWAGASASGGRISSSEKRGCGKTCSSEPTRKGV